MFAELEGVIAEVIATLDRPSTQRLCLDCWEQALAAGEAAGLSLARVVLAGAREYRAYLIRINAPVHRGQPEGAAA